MDNVMASRGDILCLLFLKQEKMSIKYREIFGKRDFTDTIEEYKWNVTKFYYKLYHNMPAETWCQGIQKQKLFEYLKEKYAADIEKVYNDSVYDADKKKYLCQNATILMANERMIHLRYDSCGVLTQDGDIEFIAEMEALLPKFIKRERTKPNEINLIVMGQSSLELKELEIKKTKLNIGMNYEDDFVEVDKLIAKRLNTKNDKGIVLLHGMPGTGKTTYLRHLIAKLKKRVMFVPNNVAVNLTDPQFISLLIENPNSVLVIEDAEQVLKDRSEGGNSAVSNLLNISDGLLADCLNIQIICSFNTQLSNIDSALMRKGRLIARYEFGKLSIAKAQKLSDSLGFKTVIVQPMSVSEIYNQNEMTFEKQKAKIGFGLVA